MSPDTERFLQKMDAHNSQLDEFYWQNIVNPLNLLGMDLGKSSPLPKAPEESRVFTMKRATRIFSKTIFVGLREATKLIFCGLRPAITNILIFLVSFVVTPLFLTRFLNILDDDTNPPLCYGARGAVVASVLCVALLLLYGLGDLISGIGPGIWCNHYITYTLVFLAVTNFLCWAHCLGKKHRRG